MLKRWVVTICLIQCCLAFWLHRPSEWPGACLQARLDSGAWCHPLPHSPVPGSSIRSRAQGSPWLWRYSGRRKVLPLSWCQISGLEIEHPWFRKPSSLACVAGGGGKLLVYLGIKLKNIFAFCLRTEKYKSSSMVANTAECFVYVSC